MIRALLLPALLSVLLVCAAAAEMLASPPAVLVASPRIVRATAASAPLRAADTGREGDTITARPLFTADRRPASAKSRTVAARALPRLSAILIAAQSRSVLFDDGGKPLFAREGGRAGPYVVMSIGADRVEVMSPDGPRTLRPTPIPSDHTDEANANALPTEPVGGFSLLQQLQRGQVPHYAVPPPPTIQNLIARMRAQH